MLIGKQNFRVFLRQEAVRLPPSGRDCGAGAIFSGVNFKEMVGSPSSQLESPLEAYFAFKKVYTHVKYISITNSK